MITFVLSMHALSFSLKRRFALEMSMLVILIRVRKPELHRKFFFFFFMSTYFIVNFQKKDFLLPLKERRQWWKKQKIVSFFKKNQFAFFYSLSTSSRSATPTPTRKHTHLVEKTPPTDKSFSVKVILAVMQGRKIGMQIFVNLKHYIKFNCNVFIFKKNLVLEISNIYRLLDLKTNLFFAIFWKSWKQIIFFLGVS